MEFSTNQGDVYVGPNRIHLNRQTMARILEQWLHVTTSGGPYKVTDVAQNVGPETNDKPENDGFFLTFEPIPTADAEQAKPVKQKRERKRRITKPKPTTDPVTVPSGFVPGDPVPEPLPEPAEPSTTP